MVLDLLVPNICGSRLQYCEYRGPVWCFVFDNDITSNLRIWTWQNVNWLYWIFMFQKKLIWNVALCNIQTDITKIFSILNVAPGVIILKLKGNNLNLMFTAVGHVDSSEWNFGRCASLHITFVVFLSGTIDRVQNFCMDSKSNYFNLFICRKQK